MRLRRFVLAGCLLPLLAGCAVTNPAPVAAGTTYTCCRDADVNRDYHPGETLVIHWIVVPGEAGASASAPEVELRAHLTGPYPTVAGLKSTPGHGGNPGNPASAATFTAAPVRPSGAPGEQPASSIAIPATAGTGYYNLVTDVAAASSTVGGATVIRVVPAVSTGAG